MQPAMTRLILPAIAVLALAGIVVSSISLHHHYDRSGPSFCNLSESLNCDIVNRSVYSEVFGVPVALIGIAGYGFLLARATVYRARAGTPRILMVASLGGLAFALYLTYIEGFVLAAWCLLCLISLSLILTICILSGVVAWSRARDRD
jgi:uncharacterized membrane protein